jgi:hypothetical protein
MKATKAEVAKRVEEILQIRLSGAEFADIRQYAAENGWNVSDRQLRRYVQDSDTLMAEGFERDRDKLFVRHVAQRRALYARTMQIGDYRTALAVAKDEAELQGLYDRLKPSALEQILASLPAEFAREVRAALAAAVSGGGDPPAGGPGQSVAGPAAPGPGPAAVGGGPDAGPVADPGAAFGLAADVVPLFAPGGQEPDGRGTGPA